MKQILVLVLQNEIMATITHSNSYIDPCHHISSHLNHSELCKRITFEITNESTSHILIGCNYIHIMTSEYDILVQNDEAIAMYSYSSIDAHFQYCDNETGLLIKIINNDVQFGSFYEDYDQSDHDIQWHYEHAIKFINTKFDTRYTHHDISEKKVFIDPLENKKFISILMDKLMMLPKLVHNVDIVSCINDPSIKLNLINIIKSSKVSHLTIYLNHIFNYNI